MQLLNYETFEGQEGSYNDLIKQLVIKTRHYYSEVPGDEFKSALPELRAMEAKITRLDKELGDETRNYLNDILEELDNESATENLLIDEVKRTAKILIPHLAGKDFIFEEFIIDFANHKGINVIEFHGYFEGKKNDLAANIFKDILQSLAYKHNVVFINSSATE